MKPRVFRFGCPNCKTACSILSAAILETGKMYLVGECINCHEQVIVEIDKVVSELIAGDPDKGN